MAAISVFVDSKSKNEKLFFSKSETEMTYASSILPVDCSSDDDLIKKSFKTIIENDNQGSYVLCAYGPLSTALSSSAIYDILEYVITNVDFDVYYLTLYGDECRLASDVHDLENGFVVRRSMSPHGIECVLFSPEGFDKIVDKYKEFHGRGLDYFLNNKADRMLIYSSFPPLINVDVSKSDSETQLIKTTICRENIESARPIDCSKRYNGNMNLFWFFLIIVFMIFIVSILVTFGSPLETESQVNQSMKNIKTNVIKT